MITKGSDIVSLMATTVELVIVAVEIKALRFGRGRQPGRIDLNVSFSE